MALRPGGSAALEMFAHARGRARSTPPHLFELVVAYQVGQIVVVTDLQHRLIAVGHATAEGRKGKPLMAHVGRSEYTDWQRKQSQKPTQRRAQRRYDRIKAARRQAQRRASA